MQPAVIIMRIFSARRSQIINNLIFFSMGVAVVSILNVLVITQPNINNRNPYQSSKDFVSDIANNFVPLHRRQLQRTGLVYHGSQGSSKSVGYASDSLPEFSAESFSFSDSMTSEDDSPEQLPSSRMSWEGIDKILQQRPPGSVVQGAEAVKSDGEILLGKIDKVLRQMNAKFSTAERQRNRIEPEEKIVTEGQRYRLEPKEKIETERQRYLVEPEEKIETDVKRKRCVKTLHLFLDMKRMRWVPELGDFMQLLQTSERKDFGVDMDCVSSGYDCDLRLTAGTNVELLKGKDAVIFGMVGPTWASNNLLEKLLEMGPEPGQTWIYYSTEPPFRVVRWNRDLNITRLKYHALMSYNSASDIHIPFGYYRPFNKSVEGPTDTAFLRDEFYNRTGLISWVATNCVDVFWPRMPFIQQLKELLPLHDYGRCGTMECLPRRSAECNKLFASYKFFLAIPNSECDDYITEKFWMISLKYGVVPVVLGAHKRDYDKVAPPNSFVHFGSFKTFADLADHLKVVDKDDALYRKYHGWRNEGEVVLTYPLKANALCRTLPHIYERKADDFKYLGDSPWYTGCRKLPSMRSIRHQYRDLESWSVWK